MLLQLVLFEIGNDRVNFKAKILKPLNKNHAEQNRLYKHMVSKAEISFSASYQFGEDNKISQLNNKKVSRPYCPFLLWLDPELASFVADNEDDITKEIPNFILWNEDWTVLKNKMN